MYKKGKSCKKKVIENIMNEDACKVKSMYRKCMYKVNDYKVGSVLFGGRIVGSRRRSMQKKEEEGEEKRRLGQPRVHQDLMDGKPMIGVTFQKTGDQMHTGRRDLTFGRHPSASHGCTWFWERHFAKQECVQQSP